MQPGIYQNISHKDYNEIDALRNSYLKKLLKCPAAAQIEDTEDTKALIIGRAAHAMTLEGDNAFHSEFVILPEDAPKRPTERQIFAKKPSAEILYAVDWWNLFNIKSQGKQAITQEEYRMLDGIRNSVKSHDFAKLLLAEGVSETTVIFDVDVNGEKVRCKVRPDRTPAIKMRCLIDLKTTVDAGYDAFYRTCVKYSYFQQAAFYLDGYNAVRSPEDSDLNAFIFIAVEKEAPYRCEVYTLSGDNSFLMMGRDQYQEALRIEMQCRKRGFYPHYQNAGAQELLPYSERGL